MTNINLYIKDSEAKQIINDFLSIKKVIPNFCETISKLSQIDDKYFAKELNNQKTLENNIKYSENEPCSPTDTSDSNHIKESFYTDLNYKCLNSYVDLHDCDEKVLKGINYAFQFLKERKDNKC